MDPAPELRTEFIPVTFHDVGQIIILFPKLCNVAIYFPGLFVPNAFWISISANRRKNRFPNIPLLPAAAVCSQCQFTVVCFLQGCTYMAQVISGSRPWCFFKITFKEVSIFIFIDVNHCISSEINGVGAGAITSIVLIGVENLG